MQEAVGDKTTQTSTHVDTVVWPSSRHQVYRCRQPRQVSYNCLSLFSSLPRMRRNRDISTSGPKSATTVVEYFVPGGWSVELWAIWPRFLVTFGRIFYTLWAWWSFVSKLWLWTIISSWNVVRKRLKNTFSALRPEVHWLAPPMKIYVYVQPWRVSAWPSSRKPRPHQQQCRSNIVEATGNNVEHCFDIVAGVDGVLESVYTH